MSDMVKLGIHEKSDISQGEEGTLISISFFFNLLFDHYLSITWLIKPVISFKKVQNRLQKIEKLLVLLCLSSYR